MAMKTHWVAPAAAFIVSLLVVWIVKRFSARLALVDVPNARSSHTAPKARGGGAGIVAGLAVAMAIEFCAGNLPRDVLLALAGGFAVALVGLIDDRFGVAPLARLAVHVAAAVWALSCLGGLPPLLIGDKVVVLGWPGYLLGTVGIVWTLNLYNFMDGIDGLAAAEGVFVAGAMCGLFTTVGPVVAIAPAFAAACLGFLCWNWPPSKIFMGDIGSGFMGYVIAVLALLAARELPVALFGCVILGGVFFVDATVTFLLRVVRRERLHVAHRSHAYQRLAIRWRSHRRMTLAALLVNLSWLLPLSYLAVEFPDCGAWLTLVALAPLAVVVLVIDRRTP
jgi:Fuc2NAc and GlcNAc transferase